MKRLFFTILIFQSLIFQPIFGQNAFCGTDELHRSLMQNDSNYRNHIDDLNSKVRHIIKNKKVGLDKSALFHIPIVVHVIHLGEPVGSGTNISDNQIHEAILGLNEYYQNSNGLGVNMNIDFCLADFDPNLQPH